MGACAYVGWRSGSEANNTPLKGVDGILGVVILLAYYAGGKNMFPAGVDPQKYIVPSDNAADYGKVITSDEQLSGLVQDCSVAICRHLKPLTLGSMKNYLSRLRNGQKPNGGVLPPVNTSYDKSGRIIVCARSFDEDVDAGVFAFNRVPDWIYTMAATKQAS